MKSSLNFKIPFLFNSLSPISEDLQTPGYISSHHRSHSKGKLKSQRVSCRARKRDLVCPELLHEAASAMTGELNNEGSRTACISLEKPCLLRDTQRLTCSPSPAVSPQDMRPVCRKVSSPSRWALQSAPCPAPRGSGHQFHGESTAGLSWEVVVSPGRGPRSGDQGVGPV